MTKRIAVVYHYYEKDDVYRDNLKYFLSVAIVDSVDYFFILSEGVSLILPQRDNIKYIESENFNNDFGGYAKFVKDFFDESYNFFIFINSSVRGPFLPFYLQDSWVDVFTSKLVGDTHLVGSSINILPESSSFSSRFNQRFGGNPPYVHIQTTAYALTLEALKHLVSIGFYNVSHKLTKDEVILSYELRLTQEIVKNRWDFCSIIPQDVSGDCFNFSAKSGDVLFKDGFYGRTISPFEVVFIKTNRDMIDPVNLNSLTLAGLISFVNKGNVPCFTSEFLQECYKKAEESFEIRNRLIYRLYRKINKKIMKFMVSRGWA